MGQGYKGTEATVTMNIIETMDSTATRIGTKRDHHNHDVLCGSQCDD
jgi:hypothetical protein